MNKKKHGFRGYIFSRPIDGQMIPQRVQGLVIRTYVEKNKKELILSGTEYLMDNCFMMLKKLKDELEIYEALVFYSIFMLPSNKSDRFDLYQKLFSNKTELHFALEEIVIKSEKDVQMLEDILMVKQLSQKTIESQYGL